MEIRKLAIENYKELINLWSKARLPTKPKGRDSKKSIEMHANPEFFMGAYLNNRLAGVAVLSSDMRKGWINRLAVDSDYRRRGVAKALIAEGETILRKHGMRIFCALIENYNIASKELFARCGYVEHRGIIYFSKHDCHEI